MRHLMRVAIMFAVVAASTVSGGALPAQAVDTPYRVLVFSKTAGFRHDSIAAGIQAIQQIGAANNFTVVATEDANQFNTTNLNTFQAVVWLNTTGDVLSATQQTAFETYIRSGRGYVGIHSAADTEYDWPFYGNLMGAYFSSHPAIQQATLRIQDRGVAATAHLPQNWVRTDEWYNYRTNPRSTAHVLQVLDESTYSGGGMGADHPHAWCKTHEGGRAFYTGSGHTIESYSDGNFRAHLLGGIRYAAGKSKADCRVETGYTTLYNGSTTGWSQAGPGSFGNSDATLTSSGGLGLLWYSARQFNAYSLKLDWRITGDSNSGIFVGFPPSSDPNVSINQGYEIQIDATDSPDRTTGSIYSFQSANIAARDANLNAPGEWNTYEILVEGERLRVFLNGVLINDFTNTNPVRSLLSGHIGIQNHGATDVVAFRNIRIRELGTPPPPPPPPGAFEAESFTSQQGVAIISKPAASGGATVGNISNGDWVGYSNRSTTGATGFTARISSGGVGGTIQVRSGSQTGTLLGSVAVPVTGGWETFQNVTTTLNGTGTGPLFLVFTGGTGSLFDVDTVTLTTGGGTRVGPITGIAGKCVDVNQSGTADGTKIQLWTCNGSNAQQWTVSGSTLRAMGKCMDVSGGGTANGTIVQLWTCNGTGAQNWTAGTDQTLRNPQSNRCLEAPGGLTADGTGLRIWDCNAGTNQRWVLP